jgi:hypothetical protein
MSGHFVIGWIYLAQERAKHRILVNTEVDLRVS